MRFTLHVQIKIYSNRRFHGITVCELVCSSRPFFYAPNKFWSKANSASLISKILYLPLLIKYSIIMSNLLLWERAKPAFLSISSVSSKESSRDIAKAIAVCLLGL